MPCDVVMCHPAEITNLILKSPGWLRYSQYLIRVTYGHCRMSSGWLGILSYVIRMGLLIWSVSHPDDLSTLSISSRWIMDIAGCQPDDLAIGTISSGWLMTNALCHPDDIRSFPKSSGWHNISWALCHSNEIALVVSHLDDLWPMYDVI